MKKLILILMVGSLFAQNLPPQSDIENMTTSEKMMLYDMNKKNPTLGTIFSLTIPSTGHAYAGNWTRGLKYFGGRVLSVGITIGLSDYFWNEGMFSKSTRMNLDRLLGTTGVIGFLYFTIGEWVDSGKEVKRYNNRLYKSIYDKEPPPISFKLQPTYQGATLTMSYSFN